MTGTIVDALQDATTALNNATNEILSLQATLTQQASASQAAATTVVNNFLARPLATAYYLDPVNGLDSNNGLAAATPKKTLESVAAALTPTQNVLIFLFNDLLVTNSITFGGNVSFLGVQPGANGFAVAQRTISFLGLANNSPQIVLTLGASVSVPICASLQLQGSIFQSNYISYSLPALPGPVGAMGHLKSFNGTSFSIVNSAVTAVPAAGALIESDNSKADVFLSATLNNAAGHLFLGITAGSNPNNFYQYTTNVTSA